jgi:hypothetical protein
VSVGKLNWKHADKFKMHISKNVEGVCGKEAEMETF